MTYLMFFIGIVVGSFGGFYAFCLIAGAKCLVCTEEMDRKLADAREDVTEVERRWILQCNQDPRF